jgi:co-chaperonin GroES (HSP10)
MIRPLADNVVLRFLPAPAETVSAGGIIAPVAIKARNRRGIRVAEVLASGPGYWDRNGRGKFIPNEVAAGELVLVDESAGQDYSLDLNVPRHNKAQEWADDRGNFRVVRHDEIHGVVEGDPAGVA